MVSVLSRIVHSSVYNCIPGLEEKIGAQSIDCLAQSGENFLQADRSKTTPESSVSVSVETADQPTDMVNFIERKYE